MEKFNIDFTLGTLSYTKAGHGPNHLIAFHGFGQDHTAYFPLAEAMASQYTCYLVDLFFHGQSTLRKCEKPLELNELKVLLDELFKKQGVDTLTVVGYSMGARFAMSLLQLYPRRVERLVLVAPDGIKNNFWYQLATYPYLMRKIFRYTVDHPDLFFWCTQVLLQRGLLPKRVVKFAQNQMNNRQQRQRVFCSWMAFRELKIRRNKSIRLINQHHISVELFFGAYDQLMPHQEIAPLLGGVHQLKTVVLPYGHNTLLRDVAAYYRQEKMKQA